MEKRSVEPKKGKRAVVSFTSKGIVVKKDVPKSRAYLIAAEYKKKTGKTVSIVLS